jgi:hypothetical protein
MNEQEMRQHFQELLPWHVNGTLDPDQRVWVENYVRTHPDAKAELVWNESLQSKFQARMPTVAADAGWDTLQQRIRQERRAAAPSILEKITKFFGGIRLTPALTTAAAVILVQAGVIGTLLKHGDPDNAGNKDIYRNVGTAPYTGPVVAVTFKEAATEKELRQLLRSVDASIISGPGQLGNYILLIPGGRINDAAKLLQANSLVEAASVLEHLPSKPD